jgi:hypothetical protein
MHLDVQVRISHTIQTKSDTFRSRYTGDLIRYAPDQILSLHPSDMSAIYGHGKPFRKSKGYATMIPIPDGWSAMTSIDKTLHHNLRRVFRSGVTTDFLAQYEPAILRNLNVYFSELTKVKDAQGWSTANDMRKWSKLAEWNQCSKDAN